MRPTMARVVMTAVSIVGRNKQQMQNVLGQRREKH